METFAAEMRANQLHYSIYGGNYAIIIPKQLREHIQAAGWTKQHIAEFLFERARVRRGEWAGVGKGEIVRDRAAKVHAALDSPEQAARSFAPGASRPRQKRDRAYLLDQHEARCRNLDLR